MDKLFDAAVGLETGGKKARGGHSRFDIHTSLWAKLSDTVSAHPDLTAVTDGGGSYSYVFFKNRVDEIARCLILHGAKRGTRVGVLLPRGIDQVASLFAASKIGAVFVPLAKNIKLNYVLQDSELSVVVCESAIEISGNEIPRIKLPPLENCAGADCTYKDDYAVSDGSDTCAIIYTSGSTNDPKGVLINHRMLINYSVSAGSYMKLLPGSKFMLYPPVMYIDALLVIVSALFSGSTLCIMDESDVQTPESISRYLERHAITHSYVHTEMASAVIPNRELRFFQTGGTPAKSCLYDNLPEACTYSNGYGLTEAGAFLFWCDGGARRLPIPLGRPIRNARVFIVSNGRLCERDETGELCVSGDCLSNGYVRNYDGSEGRFTDNPFGTGVLLHTGDLACWNDFGEVIYKGRINNNDISNYTDEQLENGIAERCERCRAVVARSAGITHIFVQLFDCASLNMINQAVEGHFQKLGLTTDKVLIHEVDSFPLTANHKISKKTLLSQFSAEEGC